jgi:hypothetical protein
LFDQGGIDEIRDWHRIKNIDYFLRKRIQIARHANA